MYLKYKISAFSVWSILSLAFLMLSVLACSADKEGEPDDFTHTDNILLALDIDVLGTEYAQRVSDTRAGVDFLQPDFEAEKLHHLRVILVNKVSGVIEHNRGIRIIDGMPLADDLKFKVVPSTDYCIYLLGNCQNISDDLDFGIDTLPVGDFYPADFIENARITSSNAPLLYNNAGSEKTDIPMTEKFEITTDDYIGALAQTQYLPLFITRVATKFAFTIRASDDYVGDQVPPITSIRINNLADTEYLLPRNTQYNPAKDEPSLNKYQGRDIVSFSSPEDVSFSDYVFQLPAPLFVTKDMQPWVWTPEIYFPETPMTGNRISCTITFDNGDYWLVPVDLPNLPYGLPRNTYVKVDITITNNHALVITNSVLPWDVITSEFDYADEVNIASDGALSFVAGTFKDLNKTTGRLVLNDYPQAAMGSFGIATPLGMRWDAYLIGENGQTDAIRFLLEDGSMVTRISGVVNNDTKTNFKIVAAYPEGMTPNSAILQVVVTTSDGRGIPANILYGAGYNVDVKNITVVQNPK